MPALKPTSFTARVTWLGAVRSTDRTELMAEPADTLDLTFEGTPGALHSGFTRPSCARVTAQYAKGTTIRNERQLSLVSAEDLTQIARALDLDSLDPARLGASIVLEGIPEFSNIPPSSRLQASSGATLAVDMQNRPCLYPARSIEAAHPGHGKTFKSAAKDRRGVTAWVAAEGRISIGDTLVLHIPDQPVWSHLDEARL